MEYKPYIQFGSRECFTQQERELFQKVMTEELPVEQVDAVVWIEGDADDRVRKSYEVFKHYEEKPFLILSGGVKGSPYRPDSDAYPDGGNIPSWEIQEYFIRLGVPQEKIIVEDISLNARDQAENVVRIAKERELKRLVLVASTWHQLRLFLSFVQQLLLQDALDIELINQPETRFPLDRKIPGRGKDTIEMIKEDLWRIDTYIVNGSVAPAEEGLKYLEKWNKSNDTISAICKEIINKLS